MEKKHLPLITLAIQLKKSSNIDIRNPDINKNDINTIYKKLNKFALEATSDVKNRIFQR